MPSLFNYNVMNFASCFVTSRSLNVSLYYGIPELYPAHCKFKLYLTSVKLRQYSKHRKV
jgi:hypothetical protein